MQVSNNISKLQAPWLQVSNVSQFTDEKRHQQHLGNDAWLAAAVTWMHAHV